MITEACKYLAQENIDPGRLKWGEEYDGKKTQSVWFDVSMGQPKQTNNSLDPHKRIQWLSVFHFVVAKLYIPYLPPYVVGWCVVAPGDGM